MHISLRKMKMFQAKLSKKYSPFVTCERISSYALKCNIIWEKENTLIIHRVSDQSLDFLSHMSISRKHLSHFLHNLKNNLGI